MQEANARMLAALKGIMRDVVRSVKSRAVLVLYGGLVKGMK